MTDTTFFYPVDYAYFENSQNRVVTMQQTVPSDVFCISSTCDAYISYLVLFVHSCEPGTFVGCYGCWCSPFVVFVFFVHAMPNANALRSGTHPNRLNQSERVRISGMRQPVIVYLCQLDGGASHYASTSRPADSRPPPPAYIKCAHAASAEHFR